MYKSIIFDMDGTLIDSSTAMTNSVNHVRASIGLAPVAKEYLEYHINEPDHDLPMKFYETPEYAPEHQKLFREHYLGTLHLHVKPYEGVFELLDMLRSKEMILSVATNAADIFANHMLESCKMKHYFSYIVGANNVKNRKPDPDMVELIMKQTGIDKTKSILIGDSIKDQGAAENANIAFAFADWGYGKTQNTTTKFAKIDDLHHYFKEIL